MWSRGIRTPSYKPPGAHLKIESFLFSLTSSQHCLNALRSMPAGHLAPFFKMIGPVIQLLLLFCCCFLLPPDRSGPSSESAGSMSEGERRDRESRHAERYYNGNIHQREDDQQPHDDDLSGPEIFIPQPEFFTRMPTSELR